MPPATASFTSLLPNCQANPPGPHSTTVSPVVCREPLRRRIPPRSQPPARGNGLQLPGTPTCRSHSSEVRARLRCHRTGYPDNRPSHADPLVPSSVGLIASLTIVRTLQPLARLQVDSFVLQNVDQPFEGVTNVESAYTPGLAYRPVLDWYACLPELRQSRFQIIYFD